jgi:2-desacetyl-2-hydroxyethyl bacteriochlorophyllide A dehydrogenase
MRAAVIAAFNKPWEIRQLPDPKPGPMQVVVRVRTSGMCGTDAHVHHGLFPLTPPVVAGHEPAGEIVEVGPGVIDLKVGDRVGTFWNQKGCGRCAACQSGHSNACRSVQSWMNLGGGNSELMLAWESGCQLIPDGVAFEDASPVFCAGYTVMSGLRNADPKPGERVAVLGVGGLGHLAVQYAKAVGLETFAITGREDKRKELKALGADEVILAGDDPGKALTEAGGADVILSTTNSAAQISAAFSGLRYRGRLISMGVADGPIAINPLTALMKQAELRGSSQDERSDLFEALAYVASGKVKPRVEVYPLEKANDALERLTSGAVRYRAVLRHAS